MGKNESITPVMHVMQLTQRDDYGICVEPYSLGDALGTKLVDRICNASNDVTITTDYPRRTIKDHVSLFYSTLASSRVNVTDQQITDYIHD